MIRNLNNHIIKIITTFIVFLSSAKSAFAQGCSWDDCPASVMSDITAAFATEGYWLLADIVYQIGETTLGLWTPLIYIMAYAAAGIMLAMGQPPKNWLWLILGPVIYNWLVFTTPDNPVKGVGWRIINEPAKQEIVWRKSEVGLLNTNQVANPSKDAAPGNAVDLPLLFLWVDELVSSTVQHLAAWSGVFRKLQNDNGSTNTHIEPTNGGGNGPGQSGNENLAWYVLSHSKWPMLESITQAKLINHNTREAFIGFLSSECGDKFFQNINKANYINAANAPGRHLPKSVFGEGKHSDIIKALANVDTPVPSAVRELLKDEGASGGGADTFSSFLGNIISQDEVDKFKIVECSKLFGLIAQAFRWEAGHVYNQIIRQVGGEYEIPEGQINYDFLYGWAVANSDDTPTDTHRLTEDEQKQFVINMILMHLIRNEFAFAPGTINKRWTQAEHDINYAESYQKTIGSKTKYGEMYTWTKLMPYIQGVLLYFLSAAYPFACMLMVVPGWHKTLFTWIGFFAWAKSWDIGFAMIGQLEKSIWAMLSNSDDDAIVNGRIWKIQADGISELDVQCNGGGGQGLGCPDPTVTSNAGDELDKLLELFDRGLLLSNNLDMDIHNSYYIYLMSALYFGVPVATGQLFLGARAGSASMVNNMASPAQQDGGRGTQTGFQSDNAAKYQANAATASQGAYAKSLRGSGLALRSLKGKNRGIESGLQGDKQNALNSMYGYQNQAYEAMGKDQGDALNFLGTGLNMTWQQNLGKNGRLRGNGGSNQATPGTGDLLSGAGGSSPVSTGDGNSSGLQPGDFEDQPLQENPMEKVAGERTSGANANANANANARRSTAGSGAAGNPQGAAGKKAIRPLAMLKNGALGVIKAGGGIADVMAENGPVLQSGIMLENGRQVQRAVGKNRVAQGRATLAGFNYGGLSKGYGEESQRFDALANHQAQEDQWNFMQDMTAGGFAGSVSIATGLSPGAISAPTQRSTNLMGMAGQGFLGSSNKSAFDYGDMENGFGYIGSLKAANAGLSYYGGENKLGFKEANLAKTPAVALRNAFTTMDKAATPVAQAVADKDVGRLTEKTALEQAGGSASADKLYNDNGRMTAGSVTSGFMQIGQEAALEETAKESTTEDQKKSNNKN